jgi:hypothetical protein
MNWTARAARKWAALFHRRTTMFIRNALIFCKDQKTDDQLKAILATHPWAPALLHGFYKSSCGTRDEYSSYGGYDALWVEQVILFLIQRISGWSKAFTLQTLSLSSDQSMICLALKHGAKTN